MNSYTNHNNESTAPTTEEEMASKILGKREIISNITVRKLNKPKKVTAPIGQPLGLAIVAVPQIGIGVCTVRSDSKLYNTIKRGDIFTEFMGYSLKNASAKDFAMLLKRKDDVSGGKFVLVVEYTAADLILLFDNAVPGK